MTNDSNSASLFDMFDTNLEAETSGIWVDVGPARFKLARMGGANTAFQKLASKKLKPFQASIDSIPEKVALGMAVDIFVETVLIGWENVNWLDNTPLECTKENAVKLFNRLPNLFSSLQEQAGKLSNFNAANLEAGAKN